MKHHHLYLMLLTTAMMFGHPLQAQTTWMVISDPHVLSNSLHDDGKAFQSYQASDSKLMAHSQELFDKAMDRVLESRPTMLLVTGDLTNDGEKLSHEHVRERLEALVSAGIKVYVIPGNHDLENPYAYCFSGESKTKAESISTDDFPVIYASCGYQDAVMRQEGGLSYMAYPTSNLALICLDSTIPNKYTTRYSNGGLTEATLAWAEQAAQKARQENRYVIAMMHHQMMEHFDDQQTIAANYVANSASNLPALASVQSRLISAGIHVMFTGHFHIQSIQHIATAEGELYDISTGSSCSYPSPIRTVHMSPDGLLTVSSETMDDYHAEEMERNQHTTEGAIRILANKMFPKIEAKKSSIPSILRKKLNLPSSVEEMVNDMNRYLLPAYTDLINTLSAGDEEQNDPDTRYAACMNAYDDYFKYLCGNSKLVMTLAKSVLADAGLDYRSELKAVCKSIFYNYVGDKENVVPDNHHTIQLPPLPQPLTGDINRDWHVDISDVTMLVNIILGKEPDSYSTSDINKDSHIDISDVTSLVNLVLEKE